MNSSPIPADLDFACDDEEASVLLHNSHFDLIIMDLNIPKFNGHAIFKRYRVQDGPPVVVFSSSDDKMEKEKALVLGANEYIVKPWKSEDFIEAVQGILHRWNPGAA